MKNLISFISLFIISYFLTINLVENKDSQEEAELVDNSNLLTKKGTINTPKYYLKSNKKHQKSRSPSSIKDLSIIKNNNQRESERQKIEDDIKVQKKEVVQQLVNQLPELQDLDDKLTILSKLKEVSDVSLAQQVIKNELESLVIPENLEIEDSLDSGRLNYEEYLEKSYISKEEQYFQELFSLYNEVSTADETLDTGMILYKNTSNKDVREYIVLTLLDNKTVNNIPVLSKLLGKKELQKLLPENYLLKENTKSEMELLVFPGPLTPDEQREITEDHSFIK